MNFREFKARLLSGHQKHFTAREMKAMTSGVRIDGLPVECEFVKPGWKFCHPDAKHVDKYISAQVFYRAWQRVLGTSSKAPRRNASKANISRPHRESWISNSGMLQCVIVEKQVDSLNSPLCSVPRSSVGPVPLGFRVKREAVRRWRAGVLSC